MLWVSLHLPQPRSSRTLAAATRAIGGQFGSIMIPASVLMAVSVYDRASDAMCPRFFGFFGSHFLLSFVTIRHGAGKTIQLVAFLKAGCGLVAPSLHHSTFRRAWGVSCRATAQPRGEIHCN